MERLVTRVRVVLPLVSDASGEDRRSLRYASVLMTKGRAVLPSGLASGGGNSRSLHFGSLGVHARKMMHAGLPTDVYWPVKVNRPVFLSTLKEVMSSLR